MSVAAAEIASFYSVFDIFAHGAIQTSVLGTTEVAYKPIAPVEQNDQDSYIDLDFKLYFRGKVISASRKDVDFSDHTGVTNNFLHYLFSQSNVLLHLLPGARLQISLNKSFDSKTVSKFLDSQLLVRRVRPNPAILLALTATLKNSGVSRAIT